MTHTTEVVRHRVHPSLRGLVAGLVGISERSGVQVRRRQPAGALAPLVFSFGEPLHVERLARGSGGGAAYDSFVAGLSTGPAVTFFSGGQDCIQAYLTPVGVSALLGVPGREVAHHVVGLETLLPPLGHDFSARLASTSDWSQRCLLVERALLGLASRARHASPTWVRAMCEHIEAANGAIRVSTLVKATGWSHRYVTTQFRLTTGLTPKEYADLVRFDRASLLLGSRPVSEIAHRFGYADQSHFARAVARYAGESPTALASAQRPTPALAMGKRADAS